MIRSSGINENNVAFLHNVGENSWCSGTSYIYRQILYKLYLVGRITETEISFDQDDPNKYVEFAKSYKETKIL